MNSAERGRRSLERLHHFQCPHCAKWWSIADADEAQTRWFCPWCGVPSEYELRVEAPLEKEMGQPDES